MSIRAASIACVALVAAMAVHAQGIPFKMPARAIPGALGSPWQQATPEALGLDSKRLADLRMQIESKLPRVKALLVVRNDQLVFEHYRQGYGHNDLHNVASVTKSVISALIGIAVSDGSIRNLDEKAQDLLPPAMLPATDPRFKDVTLEHLLTMSSGFRREAGRPVGQVRPGAVLKRPLAATPGSTFSYDNEAQHLLSVILTQRTGMSAASYAEQKLFAPLGITHYNWFADGEGHSYGSHDLFLRPRDMARIGQLYLQGGLWRGQRILPAAYVETSTRKHIASDRDGAHYGYLWWPTTSMDNTPAYAAAGFGGQYIFVVPQQQLVVVAASDQEGSGDGAGFIRLWVLPAVWK